MASTSPLISLIFTVLLITISSATSYPTGSHPSTSSLDFIQSSCHVTRYPALCYHSLTPFAAKINKSERQLAVTALAVSLSRARSAAQFVSRTKKIKGISHREIEAVKDCVDTMGDSVDQLTRSFTEMGHMGRVNDGEDFMWHISNVQTWVSAALTDANTCMDGFSGRVMRGRVKGAINMRLTNVAQVTSNALALVNHFATRD
ncbi:pectinesterase inhibitor 9-like [Silene latifolia]|uniref:pectinesterase inhibitor 9-like n=1 Tax=Silene latifolia TaxID=37657 RepID=UPI003D784597